MQCFYRKRTSMLRSVPLYNPVQCAGKLHACTGAAGITFKMGPAYSFTEKESHSVPTGKSRRKNSGICRWSSGFYQKRAWNRCQEYYLLCGTIAWTVSFFYRGPLLCPANYHLTQDFHCRIQYITFIHRKVLIKIMNIAICDDEILFTRELSSLLTHWAEKNDFSLTLYPYSNGDDLLTALRTIPVDLIFLDIIMPLLNGIDTAREIRSMGLTVPVIFLTSSREFALDSYDVKASHYLLKPVNTLKLFSVMDDFFKTYHVPAETFIAHTTDGFCSITLNDVDYLEAQNKQVLVCLSNGTTLKIRELFAKCEGVFTPAKGFFKCHRSYIVNLSHIKQFTRTMVTTGISSVPISRNNYSAFKDAYFSYMFDSNSG